MDFHTDVISAIPFHRCCSPGKDLNPRPSLRQAGALATYLRLTPNLSTS